MTSDEVGQFIQLKSRANVPSEIVDATHSPTEGNPLFVTEVVRLVKQARFGEDTNWEMRIREGIKDAISGRLSGLTKQCN